MKIEKKKLKSIIQRMIRLKESCKMLEKDINCKLIHQLKHLNYDIPNPPKTKHSLLPNHNQHHNWNVSDKKKIIKLRDKDKKTFSQIRNIMNLSNRGARNLYLCARRGETK